MIAIGAPRAATTRRMAVGAGLGLAAVILTGCGSGSSGGPSVTSGGQPPTTPAAGGSSSPAAKFSLANVSGLGNVVVDGRGRTVYILTKAGKKNLPCTDASGCTTYWPDLSLPTGLKRPTAGSGLDASLLGSKRANGEIYARYNGWLLYEYAGDSAAGQGHGEGIKTFGGVWYALTAQGTPVTSGATAGSSSSSSSGGYGY